MRYAFMGLHWLGIVAIAHALMLLGADEIPPIAQGGVLTVRSLGRILTLYGVDTASWLIANPGLTARATALLLSWPAWAILFVAGGAVALFTRERV